MMMIYPTGRLFTEMNFKQMAIEISKKEGGKVNLSIAQIREVLRCFFTVGAQMSFYDYMSFCWKYRRYYRGKKK
jgi:uncharacterized protein YhfF